MRCIPTPSSRRPVHARLPRRGHCRPGGEPRARADITHGRTHPPVGLHPAFCMSSQMASAASQRPPSLAARMAAVKACTEGAMRLSRGASRICWAGGRERWSWGRGGRGAGEPCSAARSAASKQQTRESMHGRPAHAATRACTQPSRRQAGWRRAHLGVGLQRAVRVSLAPAHLNQRGAQPAVDVALGGHSVVPHLAKRAGAGRRARRSVA